MKKLTEDKQWNFNTAILFDWDRFVFVGLCDFIWRRGRRWWYLQNSFKNGLRTRIVLIWWSLWRRLHFTTSVHEACTNDEEENPRVKEIPPTRLQPSHSSLKRFSQFAESTSVLQSLQQLSIFQALLARIHLYLEAVGTNYIWFCHTKLPFSTPLLYFVIVLKFNSPSPPHSLLFFTTQNVGDTWPAVTRVLSLGRGKGPGNEVARFCL